MDTQIKIYSTADEQFNKTAELISGLINKFINSKGKCTVVLSGGSTPKNLYRILGYKFNTKILWEKVFIFWGDERCVPPESAESNYKMAYDTFLSKIDIPQKNIFRILAELSHEVVAANYEQKLRSFFKNRIPSFDIVLLGLGEDGHIASIFENTNALNESKKWAIDNYIEKLNTWRITLTLPVFNKSKNIILIVSGEKKSRIIKEVLDDKHQKYPANFVKPENGNLTWCLDKAAASLI